MDTPYTFNYSPDIPKSLVHRTQLTTQCIHTWQQWERENRDWAKKMFTIDHKSVEELFSSATSESDRQ